LSSSRTRFLLVTSWEEVLVVDVIDELESPLRRVVIGVFVVACALARALASFLAFAASSVAASSVSSRVYLASEFSSFSLSSSWPSWPMASPSSSWPSYVNWLGLHWSRVQAYFLSART
jgi:hypothetical protein